MEDHERVIRSLEAHLRDLVSHVASLERKLFLVAAVILIGSPTAAKLYEVVGHAVGA